MGLLLKVYVHPANISDRVGAKGLLTGIKREFPRLSLLWADQGYDGAPFEEWMRAETGCEVRITNKPTKWVWAKLDEALPEVANFALKARRWVIERTFAWGGRNRRLSKDYEGCPETQETLVYKAMSRLMLRRLAAN